MTTTTLQGITHRYQTAKGGRLHLAQAGTGGPPVLLLHGCPQHWYAWRHVITALAEDHRVYALGLRGAGKSDASRRGYDTVTQTRDVLAVVDVLGLSWVTLARHEWGGWLGFHLGAC